jgi:hypothetical protein
LALATGLTKYQKITRAAENTHVAVKPPSVARDFCKCEFIIQLRPVFPFTLHRSVLAIARKKADEPVLVLRTDRLPVFHIPVPVQALRQGHPC